MRIFAPVFQNHKTMESTNKPFKRYTVTTALPYANGPVHIGHLAGVYIPADTYVRYLRMRGEEVLFKGSYLRLTEKFVWGGRLDARRV